MLMEVVLAFRDERAEMLRCRKFFSRIVIKEAVLPLALLPCPWVFAIWSMLAPKALATVGLGGGGATVTAALPIAGLAAMRGKVLISGLGDGEGRRAEGFWIFSRIPGTGLSYASRRIMSFPIWSMQLCHIWAPETSSGRGLSV